jgi:hypothetical protein
MCLKVREKLTKLGIAGFVDLLDIAQEGLETVPAICEFPVRLTTRYYMLCPTLRVECKCATISERVSILPLLTLNFTGFGTMIKSLVMISQRTTLIMSIVKRFKSSAE